MNGDKSYSDEMLNAYLDGELESDERAQVLEALRSVENLSQRVCRLQKVHSMVQLAYQDTELPEGYDIQEALKNLVNENNHLSFNGDEQPIPNPMEGMEGFDDM